MMPLMDGHADGRAARWGVDWPGRYLKMVCVDLCEPELYIIYYVTYRCFWLLESDCTRLCKYIHIVVKFGPRQYEREM